MTDAELLGAKRIRELLNAHRVMLTKSLGQNFVIDPNTIRKVVDLSGVTRDDHVLEIGAGAGSLTLELAGRAHEVTALEVDERLRPVLGETLSGVRNVDIRFEDVLRADLAAVGATKVVANLPYNIAAQTVIKILQEAPGVESLCVMTQREVGERLAAVPGSKTYGLTSVLVAFYASATVASRISRNVFFPVPAVDSVLVRIDRRLDHPGAIEEGFVSVVRAAFGQRRKNIRNALTAIASSAEVESALATAAIDPSRRAESMSVGEFVELTRAFTAQ
jgi:16S rRNA (adenine1518-N6/adenine1519-N6)-dimethyltransferase